MVLLPNGWLNFAGGGIEPGLCEEPTTPPGNGGGMPGGPGGEGGMGSTPGGGKGGGGIGAGPDAETPPPIGGGCNCSGEPELNILSCTGDYSLACGAGGFLNLTGCGGVEPYTWSKDGEVDLDVSSGKNVIVTAPENNGAAVEGDAYTLKANVQNASGGFCGTGNCTETLGCNDQTLASSGIGSGGSGCASCGEVTPAVQNGNCAGFDICTGCASDPDLCVPEDLGPVDCQPRNSPNCLSDLRTSEMITAGCNPCGLVARTSTVTLTDAEGTEVTIILTP
jgi:hypothetical protein